MTKKYIFGALNICALLSLSILLLIGHISVGLISLFKVILLGLFLTFISIVSIKYYFTNNTSKYNISAFIIFTINIILLFNVININSNYNYINNLVNHNYNYPTYNVYVKKSTTIYSDISKLDAKKIGIIKNNNSNIETILNKNIDVEYIEYDNLTDLLTGINNGEIQAIAINSNMSSSLEQKENGNKIRIIYNTVVREVK